MKLLTLTEPFAFLLDALPDGLAVLLDCMFESSIPDPESIPSIAKNK